MTHVINEVIKPTCFPCLSYFGQCSNDGEEWGDPFPQCCMPRNNRLNGRLDETELGSVEREATLRQAMKIRIQLHLAVLSFSDATSILYMFGVERAHSTVPS